MHALRAMDVGAGATGVLVALVGLLVWRVRPRDGTNRAFGAFAIAFGAVTATNNLLGPRDHLDASWAVPAILIGSAAFAVAAFGIFAVACRTPFPLGRGERGLAVVALAFAAAVAGLDAAFGATLPGYRFPDAHPELQIAELSAVLVFLGTLWGSLLILALRYRRTTSVTDRRQIALMTAALLVYPSMYGSSWVVRRLGSESDAVVGATFVVFLAPVLLLAGVWLRNAAAAGAARTGRNLAWLALGSALAETVALAAFGFDSDWGTTAGRSFLILVLAYAVVRHDLLGIDVKVRWGISRGTIAAAFVAAFFVASEGAQILFGGESEWVGLLAAGALVFTIAPLHRWAERLAERAVPVAEARPATPPASRRTEVYCAMARRLHADGGLSADDERTLAHLAQELGIGAGDALDLRRAVEREIAEARS